jgi:hypothetical protein
MSRPSALSIVNASIAPLLAVLALVLVPSGCRAGWGAAESRSYDELDSRIDADFAAADAAKAEVAALPDGTQREQRLEAWDAILQALLWAKTAAAFAQLDADAAALERIEGRRIELAALASDLTARGVDPQR